MREAAHPAIWIAATLTPTSRSSTWSNTVENRAQPPIVSPGFDPGPVSREFGGIDQFINGLAFGEFGFGWEPWNDVQSTASMHIVEGHPIDGEERASYFAEAFALWPISADYETGEIIAGVIVLTRVGDELIESDRMKLDPPEVSDFGAWVYRVEWWATPARRS